MQSNNFKLGKSSAIVASVFISVASTVLIVTPSYGVKLEDIKQKWHNLVDFVEDIQKTWADIGKDAKKATNDSEGDMGEPDPVSSSEKLKNLLKNRPQQDYTLPAAQQKGEALQRALAKASVKNITGQAGQKNTADKIQYTTQIGQEAQNIANQAQQMDASQNILKAIAAQNALVVGMLAGKRTDDLQARGDSAYSNLMLTQIAEGMANSRTKEDLRDIGTISLTHELIGMNRLDPAYKK
jgi:hypothetical protein